MAKVMIGCRVLESSFNKIHAMAKKIDSNTVSISSLAVDMLNEVSFSSELIRINKSIDNTGLTRIKASGALIYNTGTSIYALCLNNYQAEYVKTMNKKGN